MPEVSRGIHNNNPGNIKHSSDIWKGKSRLQTDDVFVQFDNPHFGIRAATRNFRTSFDKHGNDTIRKLITRWAPPIENDTEAYITFMMDHMGVGDNEPLSITNPETMSSLLSGVFQFEGAPSGTYSAEVMDEAIRSGLGLPPSVMNTIIEGALSTSPDTVAENIRLANTTSLNVNQLETLNREEVSKAATVQEILQQVSEAPATAEFLSRANAMALSSDSIDELTAIDHTINLARMIPGTLMDDLVGASLRGLGDVGEIGQRRLRDAYEAAGLNDMGLASEARDITKWLDGHFLILKALEALTPIGEALGDIGEDIKPPIEEQNLATDIVGGLAQVSGHITIAILSGGISAPVSMATLFGQGVDIQSKRLEEEGIDPTTTEADLAKIGGGVITAAVERMGLTLLFKRIPTKIRGRIYRAMAGFGTEAVQEVVEGIAHNLVALGLYKPDQDVLEGAVRDAMVAGPVGGIVGLIIPGRAPGPSIRSHRVLEKSNELIKESRLKARSPEHSAEHTSSVVAEHGIEKVFIPIADIAEYAATHKDGAAIAIQEMGISDDFVLNENDEIEIDGTIFASNILGTENFAALGENIRYESGGRSAKESAIAIADNADAILEQVDEEGDRTDITPALKTRVAALLNQTKKMSPKEVIAAIAEAPTDVTNVLDGLLAEVDEKALDISATLRKGKERDLTTQLESVNKEITFLSNEVNQRIADDKPVKSLNKKIGKLVDQRDVLIKEQQALEKGEVKGTVRVKASQIKSIETQTTKRIIAATKRGFKRARSAVKADIKSAQKQFRQIIKDSGVANQAKFLKRLVNIQSTEKLEALLPELEVQLVAELEAQQRRELLSEIRNQLKGTASPKQEGQFSPETQDLLDIAREVNQLDKEAASIELITNLNNDMPGPEQVWRNQMLAIAAKDKSITNDDLRDVLSQIVDLKTEGKTAAQKRIKKLQDEIEETRDTMIGATLQGKKIKREDTSTIAKRLQIRAKELGAAGASLWNAWDDTLDVVFNKKGVDGKFINKLKITRELLSTRVRIFRWQKEMLDKAIEIYGLKNQAALQRQLYDDNVVYIIGDYVNARGEVVEMALSKAEARDLWMKLQDPEIAVIYLHPKGNAYTEDILKEVFFNNENTKLSDQDKAWAKEQIKFYTSIFGETNEVHRRMFGTNMLFNPKFSPSQNDRGALTTEERAEAEEHSIIDEQIKRRGLAGVTKENTKAIIPQALRSDTQVMHRYMHDVAHFIETAEKVRLLNATFNDPSVRKAIAQNHSDLTNRQISSFIDDFARGYVKRGASAEKFIGYFNRNFARSVLGLKATIGIKQMTSVFAMGENIPVTEFVKGIMHFMTSPKKNMEAIFKAMPSLATRGSSIDLELAKLGNVERDILRLRKTGKLDDFLVVMIKWGDRVPIYLGTHSRTRWDAKQGISFADSVAKSEVLAERTQQSVQLDQLSDIQRMGPIGRTATMFMTARLALLRGELRAMRQFRRGKISKKEFGKRLAYYHVIMPAMISMIGAGMSFDEEDFIKAITLGQLTSFVFIGDILEAMTIEALGGDAWGASQDIPLVETLNEVRRGFIDVLEEGPSLEAFAEAMAAFGKFTGKPIKQIENMIIGAYEIVDDTIEQGVKMILGWSERVAKKSSALKQGTGITF